MQNIYIPNFVKTDRAKVLRVYYSSAEVDDVFQMTSSNLGS